MTSSQIVLKSDVLDQNSPNSILQAVETSKKKADERSFLASIRSYRSLSKFYRFRINYLHKILFFLVISIPPEERVGVIS